MTPSLRAKLPDLWITVISVLITSVIGGGGGMYVGYRIIEYRVSQLEVRVEKSEANYERLIDKLTDVARDVAYLRGTQERDRK